MVKESIANHRSRQDGTINYLTLPAVTDGLRFLTAYLPFLPLRLSCLTHFLTTTISELRHDTSKRPIVRILSRLPGRRLKSVGEQADTASTVSLLFHGVRYWFYYDVVYKLICSFISAILAQW